MKILIADKFSDSEIGSLRAAGHAVVYDAGLKDAALTTALAAHKPEVLIVRSTRVSAADMDANPSLELVVRAGSGYDTIDLSAASSRGIFVANCPGKNAVAVAELAFGLILALDRQIPDNVAEARAGRWDKARFSKAEGVMGRTLGLLGVGNIGREMVKRAAAFGMQVVGWDKALDPEGAAAMGIGYCATALEVALRADVVSIHLALNAETQGLVGAAFLDAMKPGALLVNAARGAIIDEGALVGAMADKGIRVATDVLSGEPGYKQGALEHPLANHPSVYVTHHIGASTAQATAAIGAEAVRVVQTYAETGRVPNCVNLETHSPATHLLTIRHLDRVGVLARILDVMRRAEWNVQEMENLVFAGAEAACARIRFAGYVSPEPMVEIERAQDVLAVSLIEL